MEIIIAAVIGAAGAVTAALITARFGRSSGEVTAYPVIDEEGDGR
jgi:hypothetical protein